MTRYIDADAYKNHLEFYQWTLKKFYPNCRGLIARVISLVDDMETVDAVPVRHGKWENTRPDAPMFGFYYCSLCGRKRTSPQDRYCPNCGANMAERKEE